MNITQACQVISGDIPILNLTIEDGSTDTQDRSSLIRGSCSLTLTDPDGTLVAATARQALLPWGNEITLYYGVVYDDGTTELILRGTYLITTMDVADSGGDLVITLAGMDRSRAVQRDVFTDSGSIPPGTNVALAIQSVVLSRNLGFTPQFNFTPTTFVTPPTPTIWNAGDDPWQFCTDLAAGIGCELYPDANGVFTMLPTPDPTVFPNPWPFDEGPDNLATEVEPVTSSDQGFNVWIRDGVGTGIDPPIRGQDQDNNPTSPTWVGNPNYGTVTDYQQSSLYTTQAQAQVAATAAKIAALGSSTTLTLTAMVKPDTQIDDVIEVARVRADIPAGSLFVVDSVTVTYGPSGDMQLGVRTVIAA